MVLRVECTTEDVLDVCVHAGPLEQPQYTLYVAALRSWLPISPISLYGPCPCSQRCTSDGLDHQNHWELGQAVEGLHFITSLAAVLHLHSCAPLMSLAAMADGDLHHILEAVW